MIGKFFNAFASGISFATAFTCFATHLFSKGMFMLILCILNVALYFIQIDS